MAELDKTPPIPVFMYPVIAVTLCAGAGMISAVYVVIMQAMNWIKTGEWKPLPADWVFDAVGIHMPITKMIGAERIIEFLVWTASPAPLAVTALVAGFIPVAILLLGMHMALSVLEDAKLRRQRQARG